MIERLLRHPNRWWINNIWKRETYSEDANGVGVWTAGTAPADRYNEVTITVPTGLKPDASRDPESAELRVAAEQFDGTINLNNAFGSDVGYAVRTTIEGL